VCVCGALYLCVCVWEGGHMCVCACELMTKPATELISICVCVRMCLCMRV